MRFSMVVLLLVGGASLSHACPRECRCSLDIRGRKRVLCGMGGLKDQIPVLDMATDTEVLILTAPKNNPNAISLGPIFTGLRKLEEIHVTWSGVPALGAHSFWGLARLRVLNLTHNHISLIRDTNFRGADAMRHLDLSHNRIESVPSAVFRHVRHLRHLSLSHNLIPELVPRVFFGLNRLEHLDLSHNPLGDLQPDRFSDVPDLRFFSCAGCSLMSVSPTLLEGLPALRVLNLRDNRLTQIPQGILLLPQLETLYLDGNHLSFLERGVMGGSPVSRLHLSNNRIIRLEAQAFANSSVTHLDISYNRLSHLEPGSMDEVLDQLQELKLSGNALHVSQLSSVLPRAHQLRHLGLGDMGLIRLPVDLLRHARNLHHLNVSANYLEEFPPQILQSMPHLRSLDLSLNSFRGLHEDLITVFKDASELRLLRLEGNPWHCDQCHVTPLLRWLQGAPDQASGCRESRVWTCLKCVGPRSVAGQRLALLPPGDLPVCLTTAAPRPTWAVPSRNVVTDLSATRIEPLSDDPDRPRGQLTRYDNDWWGARVMREDLYLVVVGGCIVLLLLLLSIILIVVLYNRHSAFYYTYEKDENKKESLMGLKEESKGDAKNNNTPKILMNPDVTIATIDELTDINGSQEVLEVSTRNGSINHANTNGHSSPTGSPITTPTTPSPNHCLSPTPIQSLTASPKHSANRKFKR